MVEMPAPGSVTLPLTDVPLPPPGPVPFELLAAQVRDIPFFRALLRSFEAHFFRLLNLPRPVLDLGSGDGHFAYWAYPHVRSVGLDPDLRALRHARRWPAHRLRVQGDGGRMPFASGSFRAVVSNSVLEHIPHIDRVLEEAARVLQPGGWLVFSVPNHRFEEALSVARALERAGLQGLARRYRAWFQRISRHVHCDPPERWTERLQRAGFQVRVWWHYFPQPALAALEWGHYLGVPSLVVRGLTGRWTLVRSLANFGPILLWLRRYLNPAVHPQGAYTFYIAQRC